MDRVKIGVIGVGALGKHHARLYAGLPDVELVGVYDRDAATAERVAAEHKTRAFATVEELAALVDGLSVAVPTDKHHAAVKPLLAAGKHILVEKPLTTTVAEGRELVALAAARKLVLQVGHVERFNPVLECLDRTPGEARFIEAHRLAPYPPPRPGLLPRGTEVSVVLDLMIHDLDILLYLVRSPVVQVDAVGVPILSRSEDIANARIQFANGCVANVTASRVSQEAMRKIRVFKTQAYLSLDYGTKKGETVFLQDRKLVRQEIAVEDANALELELADFVRCISEARQTGTPPQPRVSGEDGLQALALAGTILERIRAAGLAMPKSAL
ncbi:MAG: Gfo/Idh/MocA family oxidoreductase [Lentisphaeria bacterium]